MSSKIIFITPAHRTSALKRTSVLTDEGKKAAQLLNIKADKSFSSAAFMCVDTLKVMGHKPIVSDILDKFPDKYPELSEEGQRALDLAKVSNLSHGTEGVFELSELSLDQELKTCVTNAMNKAVDNMDMIDTVGDIIDLCFSENQTVICCLTPVIFFIIAKTLLDKYIEIPKPLQTLCVTMIGEQLTMNMS